MGFPHDLSARSDSTFSSHISRCRDFGLHRGCLGHLGWLKVTQQREYLISQHVDAMTEKTKKAARKKAKEGTKPTGE